VAEEYHGRVEVQDVIIDACAMKLVLDPGQFDVIVTTNMFGDILSDEIAGLVGGLGLAPGANVGETAALFEAVHGSAPDIAGRGIANPTALLFAAGMMLDYLGWQEAAALILGEHDFRAFTPTETQHDVFLRTVLAAGWEYDGDRLDFTVTADSFLRHMVRTLVGTMLEAGTDAPARMQSLLDGGTRPDAGLTAPPWGLYLERVQY